MAADCVFIAENVNGVSSADILKDFSDGFFPKSNWSTGPLDPEVYKGHLMINDCCRKHRDGNYQRMVIEYLERKCGGRAGVWSDTGDPEGVIDELKKNPDMWWSELKNITAID